VESVIKILDTLGYIATVVVIVAFLRHLYLWVTGITPALTRLGKGLASRKIAIFAKNDDFNSLKSLLIDSDLFKERNIIQITEKEIKKAKEFSLFLIHWKNAKDFLDSILSVKDDTTALIVYAPQDEGLLSPEEIKKINLHRNVVLVNMRGRLLNDIIISLITTSYEKE
jgi:hypothetical protein